MRERPILFGAPMVRAILEGRKTQTRRVISSRAWAADSWPVDDDNWPMASGGYPEYERLACPYGRPGDRLWVRETHCLRYFDISPDGNATAYRVDFDAVKLKGLVPEPKWRPSIHMPRWASRITLEVTGVRVERLQDISEHDARAEGFPLDHRGEHYDPPKSDPWQGYATASFCLLWDRINAKRAPWASNPRVWVVEFKCVEQQARAA